MCCAGLQFHVMVLVCRLHSSALNCIGSRVSMVSSKRTLLSFFLLFLIAVAASSAVESPGESCGGTSLYHKLGYALPSAAQLPSNRYEYGRCSVGQALEQARSTASMLDVTVGRVRGNGGVGVGPLEDCRTLTSLTIDYLEEAQGILGRNEDALDVAAAARVRSLMSAVVTNQQTCFDGLEESRSFPELRADLDRENRLYDVSLELVASALICGPAPPSSNANNAGRQNTAPANFLIDGRLDVAVPVNKSKSVRVAQDGTGNFSTVGEAIAFAPNDTSVEEGGYFAIYVSEGVYQENVIVPKNKKNLILIGAGTDRTVITSDRNAADGWTTFNTATFAVHGDRFIAQDMTFENTAGPAKHQAVAMRNNADLSIFYRCRFLGYQDTLYAHSNRQFYRDCDIYGTVDFIFGNAAAVFQNCHIYARQPLRGQANVVTAQGRTCDNQSTGFSIHNCTIGAAPELAAGNYSAKTFLGRPWKEFSRTVYMQSYIKGMVEAAGWMAWNGSFALSTLYYGEYQNYGPGAATSRRVQWPGHSLMNMTDAFQFTVYNFTTAEVWLASTSVPYHGGLL